MTLISLEQCPQYVENCVNQGILLFLHGGWTLTIPETPVIWFPEWKYSVDLGSFLPSWLVQRKSDSCMLWASHQSRGIEPTAFLWNPQTFQDKWICAVSYSMVLHCTGSNNNPFVVNQFSGSQPSWCCDPLIRFFMLWGPPVKNYFCCYFITVILLPGWIVM